MILGRAGLPVEGGYDWEVWLNASRRRPFVEYSLDLAVRVIDQVGGSPAFRGFYLSQEMNLGDSGQCMAAGGFYAEMIGGAHGRRGLRAILNDLGGARFIAVAPYLAVAGQSAATIGSRLRCLYDKLQAARGVDRIVVQDGVPKGEAGAGFTLLSNVGSYYSAMRTALPVSGREALWVDLETYAWPDAPCTSAPGGSRPASIDRIGDQVREIGRHVGGFSQWVHAHNFRAGGLDLDSCDPSRAALGAAYRTRPFPFHAFNYQSYVIIRGYRLEPGGTARLSCNTASGRSTFDIRAADGLGVSYAPSWVIDADLPDRREIVEVSLPRPAACTGGYSVVYLSPAGVASSAVAF